MTCLLTPNARASARLAIVLAAVAGACAAAAPPQPCDGFACPVAAAVLAEARGGFVTDAGVPLSFGIERTVSVNGEVVAQSRLQIADLSRLGNVASQDAAALSSVKLVQLGDANIYQAGPATLAGGGLVIQNSINDQLIRSQTVINASVGSMGLLKTLNFQSSLDQAIVSALAPR
jgi:hypothetical protein